MSKRSKNTAANHQAEASNTPAATIRLGNLKCVLWRNEGEKGAWYNVDLVRTFKNESGFHDTHSIPADDLLRVAFLAQQAFEKLQELRSNDRALARHDSDEFPAP
jgi:hypothetical protein